MMNSNKKEGKRISSLRLYIIVMLIWNFLIFITPILEIKNQALARPLFSFFSYFCHQKFERSLCLNEYLQIGNCKITNGFIYQFPVCSRDTAIYFAMLLGGFILLFMKKDEEKEMPNILYFILLILPMAIDGGTQLIGLRESTNEIRIITGFLAGIAIPFYLVPLMNQIFGSKVRENNH